MPTPRLDPQNPACFDALHAAAIDFYIPVTPQERFAVERIALAQLSILRAARLEDQVFHGLEQSAPDPKLLSVVLRYQAEADRQYRRAITDLARLIELREQEAEEDQENAETGETAEPDGEPLAAAAVPFPLPFSLPPFPKPATRAAPAAQAQRG